jgi:hypothetical protein
MLKFPSEFRASAPPNQAPQIAFSGPSASRPDVYIAGGTRPSGTGNSPKPGALTPPNEAPPKLDWVGGHFIAGTLETSGPEAAATISHTVLDGIGALPTGKQVATDLLAAARGGQVTDFKNARDRLESCFYEFGGPYNAKEQAHTVARAAAFIATWDTMKATQAMHRSHDFVSLKTHLEQAQKTAELGDFDAHLNIRRVSRDLATYFEESAKKPVATQKETRNRTGLGANRPYACNHCGRRFTRKLHKQRHEVAHSGEKPVKCKQPDCKSSFTREDNMWQHFVLIHVRNGRQVLRGKNGIREKWGLQGQKWAIQE